MISVIELFSGIPVINALLKGPRCTGVETASADVKLVPKRLAIPGRAFASWITIGTPHDFAAKYEAALTYPPKPISSDDPLIIERACIIACNKFKGSKRTPGENLRASTTFLIVRRVKPAAGTNVVSNPCEVPIKIHLSAGFSFIHWAATARAGSM